MGTSVPVCREQPDFPDLVDQVEISTSLILNAAVDSPCTSDQLKLHFLDGEGGSYYSAF